MPTSSLSRVGGTGAWVETGTVVQVNPDAFTISWTSDASEKELDDIPIMSPAYNQTFGEGFYCLPEVGSRALVLFPSDRSYPIVLGFFADPETKEKEEEDAVEEDSPVVTFAGGRQPMKPGDFAYYGREGNFICLRRDGSVGIGSSPGCQTMYFPLQNLLWHVCKKAKLDTAGGQLFWEVVSTESEEDVTQIKAYIKEKVDSKKASVFIRMGKLNDLEPLEGDNPGPIVCELLVAPEEIDDKGMCPRYKLIFRFDHNGNMFTYTEGTVTTEIKETWDTTCKKQIIKVIENSESKVGGDKIIEVDGDFIVKANNIRLEAQNTAYLIGNIVKLGKAGATQAFINGLDFINMIAMHTHAFFGAPPNEGPTFMRALSQKIFGE